MQKLTENNTCSSNIWFRAVINISGRVSRICAVDKESRVQDEDVGSFPVTRHSAGEASRIIGVTVKKNPAHSLDFSVGSYISSPTYSGRFHKKRLRGFAHTNPYQKSGRLCRMILP